MSLSSFSPWFSPFTPGLTGFVLPLYTPCGGFSNSGSPAKALPVRTASFRAEKKRERGGPVPEKKLYSRCLCSAGLPCVLPFQETNTPQVCLRAWMKAPKKASLRAVFRAARPHPRKNDLSAKNTFPSGPVAPLQKKDLSVKNPLRLPIRPAEVQIFIFLICSA